MISGIVALIPLLLAATAAPDPAAPDPAALVARLARPAPADTAYVEVRFVNLLKQPLVLHGELHYGGPGKLGKRVDEPYHEATMIDNGAVEVRRNGKSAQRFSLERAPELQTLLAAFGALLGGDAATLEKYYEVRAQQADARFTLSLTSRPNGDAKRKPVNVIVDGEGNEPRCFSYYPADGDASVMLLGTLAGAELPAPLTRAALEGVCQRLAP